MATIFHSQRILYPPQWYGGGGIFFNEFSPRKSDGVQKKKYSWWTMSRSMEGRERSPGMTVPKPSMRSSHVSVLVSNRHTLRSRQHGWHFEDNIFKISIYNYFNEILFVWLQFQLKIAIKLAINWQHWFMYCSDHHWCFWANVDAFSMYAALGS